MEYRLLSLSSRHSDPVVTARWAIGPVRVGLLISCKMREETIMAKWREGQSGNPGGRKRGSRNMATLLRDELRTAAPDVIATLVEKAKDGEPGALKLVIDRLAPPARSAPLVSPLRQEGTAADKADAVIELLDSALLTTDDADCMLQAIRMVTEICESIELDERLIEVEKRLENLGRHDAGNGGALRRRLTEVERKVNRVEMATGDECRLRPARALRSGRMIGSVRRY